MIKAVVFDMDGLMIDSQPYWHEAQVEFFSQLGTPIAEQDMVDTTGMRIDQIVKIYFAESPWTEDRYQQACDQMLDYVLESIRKHKPAMPGLNHAIEVCRQEGVQLAIASSSPMSLIDATIDVLKLDGIFSVKSSGADLRYGKPHPEVYLNACDELNIEPQHCLALEDSFVGLLSAKSAQMKTIVVPEPSFAKEKHFAIADFQLASLNDLTPDMVQSL